jgi:hypothetical protein
VERSGTLGVHAKGRSERAEEAVRAVKLTLIVHAPQPIPLLFQSAAPTMPRGCAYFARRCIMEDLSRLGYPAAHRLQRPWRLKPIRRLPESGFRPTVIVDDAMMGDADGFNFFGLEQ